jgi:arylsulfatase A-like enzyme
MAHIRADDIRAGDRGTRSAFDVVPTIVDLLGYTANRDLSGTSLFSNEIGHAAELRPAV